VFCVAKELLLILNHFTRVLILGCEVCISHSVSLAKASAGYALMLLMKMSAQTSVRAKSFSASVLPYSLPLKARLDDIELKCFHGE
jgi:hypothetical protein